MTKHHHSDRAITHADSDTTVIIAKVREVRENIKRNRLIW